MPALLADIQSANREAILTTSSTPAVKAAHAGARSTDTPGGISPEAFWDDEADAIAMNVERAALMGALRRRFAVPIDGVAEVLALDWSQVTPAVTLVDAEHAVNGAALIARLEVNLDDEQSSIETFG